MPTLNVKIEPLTLIKSKDQVQCLEDKLRLSESPTTLFHMNDVSYFQRFDGSKLLVNKPGLFPMLENDYSDVLNAKTRSANEVSFTKSHLLTEKYSRFSNEQKQKVSPWLSNSKENSEVKHVHTQKNDIKLKCSNYISKKALIMEKLSTLENIFAHRKENIHPVKSSEKKISKTKNESQNHDKLNIFSALCKGVNIHEKESNKMNLGKGLHISSSKPPPSKNAVSQTNSNNTTDAESCPNSEQVYCVQRRKSLSREERFKLNKVFLSEKQSGLILDCGMAIPCAPPATPTPEQLKKTDYVPSLQDIKSQRLVRQRLQKMEEKELKKERKKLEADNFGNQKSLKEMRQDLKKMQRREIYALNKVMTDLEYKNFMEFMVNIKADDY